MRTIAAKITATAALAAALFLGTETLAHATTTAAAPTTATTAATTQVTTTTNGSNPWD